MVTISSLKHAYKGKWVEFAATFITFLAVAQVSSYLYHGVGASFSVILSPAGVGLAAVILAGFQMLPAIALAVLVNGLINGTPFLVILGGMTGNVLQAGILYFILKQLHFDRRLATVGDMFALVSVALVGSIIAPTTNYIFAKAYIALTGLPYATPWMSWWLGGAISMLVLTPFLIRWVRRSMTPRSLAAAIETSIAIGLTTVTSLYLFGTSTTSVFGVSLIFILVGILFWLAFRSGPRFMTLALFIMTVVSFWGALYGTYEPQPGGLPARIFNTQVFDLLIAFFFFVLVSLEEQRRHAVRLLSEQNKALQGTVGTISNETRAKNEFIATLAHELRNPLAPLLTSVETMKLTAPPMSEHSKALDLMHTQIKTMGYLLDDLLDISRITQRKFALKKAMIDLETVIRRAVEVSMSSITAHKHLLTVVLPERPVEVEIDALRIEQAVINLLHNAAKYTPDGGNIELAVGLDNDILSIVVRDTGIGIPADMLDRIFEPFVQIHAVRKESSSAGIGIGLALTKNLIELHGGTIAVRPAPSGVGTEFEIRIPVISRELSQTKSAPVVKRTAENQGLTILVVDDNQSAADALVKLLNLRGQRATVAYDGASALATLASTIPDAVVLDIGLPDMDGYEVAKRMRAAQIPTVLIALTGYGQDDDRKKSEAAGFDHHLVKPVGLAELEPVLASIGSRSSR